MLRCIELSAVFVGGGGGSRRKSHVEIQSECSGKIFNNLARGRPDRESVLEVLQRCPGVGAVVHSSDRLFSSRLCAVIK